MNISQLQSLLRRNADEIHTLHTDVECALSEYRFYKETPEESLLTYYSPESVENVKKSIRSYISNTKRKISKLADLQVAIKDDIKHQQELTKADERVDRVLQMFGGR